MTEKAKFQEQETRWETSLQGAIREAGVRNGKLQEKLEYQEILMEEYKQESKKKKLELKE